MSTLIHDQDQRTFQAKTLLSKPRRLFFGIIKEKVFLDFLEMGKVITGAHYASLMNRLTTESRKRVYDWPSIKSVSIPTTH